MNPKETVHPVTGEILPAVLEVSDVIVPISAFAFTPTAMIFREAPSYEVWALMGRQLQYIQKCSPWWIGDWLLGGEALFGDKYLQAIHLTGNEQQTLMNKRWVAGRIPAERRREALSFTHHAEVAGLRPEEQERWLDAAERDCLTCGELRQAIRAEKKRPTEDNGRRPDTGLLLRLRTALHHAVQCLNTTPALIEEALCALDEAIDMLDAD